MPVDYSNPEEVRQLVEDLGKRGMVCAVLSQKPALVATLRDQHLAGTTGAERAARVIEIFDRLADQVDHHGRECGCASFEESCTTFVDDLERGISQARTRAGEAFGQGTIRKHARPFDNPSMVAVQRAAPMRGQRGTPVDDPPQQQPGGGRPR